MEEKVESEQVDMEQISNRFIQGPHSALRKDNIREFPGHLSA